MLHGFSRLTLEEVIHGQEDAEWKWKWDYHIYDLYTAPSTAVAGIEVEVGQDVDTCITALTIGWDVLCNQFSVDESWQRLRLIDENILSHKDHATRIATMHLFRRISLYLNLPMEQRHLAPYKVPLWLLPRPSQTAIDHADVINYVPWPCMRERLCFGGDEYKTDQFWLLYHQNYRFRWPHLLSEVYAMDPMSGLQRFSPKFLESVCNLESWTMGNAFLEKYPEFEPDIVIAQHLAGPFEEAQARHLRTLYPNTRRPRPQSVFTGNPSLKRRRMHDQLGSYLASLATIKSFAQTGREDEELNTRSHVDGQEESV